MGKLRKSNFTLKSLTSIISLYMDIQTYRELLQQIIEESPNERVYQLKLIQPFLEEIFKEKRCTNAVQIVDTSWTRNSEFHTREFYTYLNSKKVGTSPDIIIAQNYKYKNIKIKPSIYVDIDVKTPTNNDMPDYNNYIHSCEQIARYLQKVDNVILTNCWKWYFYEPKIIRENEAIKYYLESFPEIREKKRQIEPMKEFVNGNKCFTRDCFNVQYYDVCEKNYDACRTQIIKWLIEKINDCKLEKTIDLSKNDFEAKQDFDKLKEYILEIVEKAIAKR